MSFVEKRRGLSNQRAAELPVGVIGRGCCEEVIILTCPRCTSFKTKKKGLSNGVQRYMCRWCGKTFQTVPDRRKSPGRVTWFKWLVFDCSFNIIDACRASGLPESTGRKECRKEIRRRKECKEFGTETGAPHASNMACRDGRATLQPGRAKSVVRSKTDLVSQSRPTSQNFPRPSWAHVSAAGSSHYIGSQGSAQNAEQS